MTRLSRLLRQSPNLRLADYSHNPPDAASWQRRRIFTPESLEGRTLLSNITVVQNAASVVTITGDTHNDQFGVTVNKNNTVTIVGTETPLVKTQVNNRAPGVAYTSPLPALGLIIGLPGTGNNLDVVALVGQGQTVATTLKSIAVNVTGTPDLEISVTGIKIASGPGTFTLTDGTAAVAGGELSAILTDDQFSTLTIFQTGCCPAFVDLENDIVIGAVAVTEGVANGNGIDVDQSSDSFSTFGSTTLTQFAGPTMAGCNGDGDFILFDDADIKDLTMHQGDGKEQFIQVGFGSEVEVSDASFGIVATQRNGDDNTIFIFSITTSGKPLNNPHAGPDSIVTTQGNGDDDVAVVDSTQVWGNISSTQGNGNGDFVQFSGDTAGWTVSSGPTITDFFGTESIIQGNGYNDTATIDSGQIENSLLNFANNVVVSQGTSLAFVGCTPGLGDVINVNDTIVVSDMTLEQGEGDTTAGLGLGNNVVNIATLTAVVVGDSTVINEIGPNNGNNTIILGGASGGPDSGSTDFETGYLDAYTGAAGGAAVQVYNTLVDIGALGLFGPVNVNGDGDGNTAVLDSFSSLTVTSAF